LPARRYLHKETVGALQVSLGNGEHLRPAHLQKAPCALVRAGGCQIQLFFAGIPTIAKPSLDGGAVIAFLDMTAREG
jgi:hypothetical protein